MSNINWRLSLILIAALGLWSLPATVTSITRGESLADCGKCGKHKDKGDDQEEADESEGQAGQLLAAIDDDEHCDDEDCDKDCCDKECDKDEADEAVGETVTAALADCGKCGKHKDKGDDEEEEEAGGESVLFIA
jgi:hypothetical protein